MNVSAGMRAQARDLDKANDNGFFLKASAQANMRAGLSEGAGASPKLA